MIIFLPPALAAACCPLPSIFHVLHSDVFVVFSILPYRAFQAWNNFISFSCFMAICGQILNAVRTSKMFTPCRRFWMVHWGPFMLLVDSNTKNVRIRLYIICMVRGFVSDVRTFCDGSPNVFGVSKQCDEWTLQTCSSYVKKKHEAKIRNLPIPDGFDTPCQHFTAIIFRQWLSFCLAMTFVCTFARYHCILMWPQ